MSETTTNPNPPISNSPVTPNPMDIVQSIHLTIRNTKKILFDEEAKCITSINERGRFDILPLHENFISLIQKYIIIYKLNGDKQTMEIDNGVVHVTNNVVHCYINLLTTPATPPSSPPPDREGHGEGNNPINK
jgi:hypothetical protein